MPYTHMHVSRVRVGVEGLKLNEGFRVRVRNRVLGLGLGLEI